MSVTRNELAERIKNAAIQSFKGAEFTVGLRGSAFGLTTTLVKGVFGDLGRELNYDVAATGYPHAQEGEWLYDMVWYSMDKGYMVQQHMVLESEFNPGGGGMNAAEVDGDFQKLIQARAEVRVWFVLIPSPEAATLHIANCKRQAQIFVGSVPGDTYVLVAYNWTQATTQVDCFEVTSSGEARTISSDIV